MCQAVFGDLSVCTEPASLCLSATCVSLYSVRPTGLGWLICQAVCWPPLRSLHYLGLIPVVLKDDWFVKQFLQPSFLAPCRASCDQLSRLSGELYVNFHNMDDECSIFSLFSFSFFVFSLAPVFIVLISLSSFVLPPSPTRSLNLLLVFDGRNWHTELWFVSEIVASSATCHRNLSRHINTGKDFLDCICLCKGERDIMFLLVLWAVCQSLRTFENLRAQTLMCMCNWM